MGLDRVTAEGGLEVVVTTGEGVAGAERAASREEDAEAALALGAACGRCCTPCTCNVGNYSQGCFHTSQGMLHM